MVQCLKSNHLTAMFFFLPFPRQPRPLAPHRAPGTKIRVAEPRPGDRGRGEVRGSEAAGGHAPAVHGGRAFDRPVACSLGVFCTSHGTPKKTKALKTFFWCKLGPAKKKATRQVRAWSHVCSFFGGGYPCLVGVKGKPNGQLGDHPLSGFPVRRFSCGSKLKDRRGKPQVLVHVSTYRSGNPCWVPVF